MDGSVSSEPSEQRNQLGSELVQGEQMDICFSKDVSKSSLTEQLGSSNEKILESGPGSLFREPSDQENHLGSEHLQHKLVATSSALSCCAGDKNLKSSSENATNSSLTVLLQPQPQDVAEGTETGRSSRPHQVTLEQHDSASGFLFGEPPDKKAMPDSDLVQMRPEKTGPTPSSYVVHGQLSQGALTEHLGLPAEDVCKISQTGKSLFSQETSAELGFANDLLAQKGQLGSDLVQNALVGTITAVFNLDERSVTDHLELPPEDASRNSQAGKSSCFQQSTEEQTEECGSGINEQVHHLDCGLEPSWIGKNSSPIDHIGPPPEGVSKNLGTELLGPPPEDISNNCTLEKLETPPQNTLNNTRRLGRRDKRTQKSLRKKYMLRSLVASDRVLRSRMHGKPRATESNINLANESTVEEKQRKRKKTRGKRIVADEFSRIRTHLRYLMNRMGYEQSLIDAYSSEGWKGGSLEKLKPEKELQRATSEILRRKLKIRDLFHRLDSLCAEGRLPESLFDSEGQICSEDIFCAKCGSTDLSTDNDIILCDGACDRGFHQYCLEPPLLSEDIPPDDNGWLCPGCDCKVDCIDLVNDSQGSSLSIADSWEKVFPEAAATAGHNPHHDFRLPSDDSDDNDYDPDGQDDEKVESSSSESEYASAPEELAAPPKDEQYLGLPSDDSEDDDYDPVDQREKLKQESSSSDFTSDSEDLAAALDDDKSFRIDEDPLLSTSLDRIKSLRGSGGKRSKPGGKKQSSNDELLSILESHHGQDGSPSVSSGKRPVERLDYKKLYDETYGNVPTDSSDDEDYNGIAEPRNRKKTARDVYGNAPTDSSDDEDYNGIAEPRNRKKTARDVASMSPNGKNTRDKMQNLEETDHTPKRTRQNTNIGDTSNSPSCRPSSSCKRTRSSAYRRLGEAVTQRLYYSFKENQYPERATKESLAQELGLTFQQVSKWFENARWSFHHSSRMEAGIANSASKQDGPSSQADKELLKLAPDTVTRDAVCNGAHHEASLEADTAVPQNSRDLTESTLETQESGGQKSAAPNCRKRKGRPDCRALDPDSRSEELQQANEVPSGGGIKTRRRKSVY